jgi:methionyl-tRNA formyltransferase
VPIDEKDDALSLYKKLTSVASRQVEEFTKSLANNTYIKIPQDHSCANYWRKRTVDDGKIDWRMSARGIYNLVRALARPYAGAHCIYQNQVIKIWRTEITDLQYENIEPGKVIAIEEGSNILIKCGDRVLRLVEHEFRTLPKAGDYL